MIFQKMTNSHNIRTFPSIEGSLTGATLMMPAISVGNIGQLAMDILVTTLKAKKLASCYHPSMLPLVGPDPYDTTSDDLMMACDIYKPTTISNANLILMQIRSAIAPNKNNEFLDDLIAWCKEAGIAKGKYQRVISKSSKLYISKIFRPGLISLMLLF